jgi:hypothetical protein
LAIAGEPAATSPDLPPPLRPYHKYNPRAASPTMTAMRVQLTEKPEEEEEEEEEGEEKE